MPWRQHLAIELSAPHYSSYTVNHSHHIAVNSEDDRSAVFQTGLLYFLLI